MLEVCHPHGEGTLEEVGRIGEEDAPEGHADRGANSEGERRDALAWLDARYHMKQHRPDCPKRKEELGGVRAAVIIVLHLLTVGLLTRLFVCVIRLSHMNS